MFLIPRIRYKWKKSRGINKAPVVAASMSEKCEKG
jgi:hypothetical protein